MNHHSLGSMALPVSSDGGTAGGALTCRAEFAVEDDDAMVARNEDILAQVKSVLARLAQEEAVDAREPESPPLENFRAA